MLDTSIPFYDFGQYIKGQPDYFAYDLALHCENWLRDVPTAPHNDIMDLYLQVRRYVIRKNGYRPDSFPAGSRVYVFDNRLRPLFATVDKSGRITQAVSDMVYQYAMEDSVLGALDADFCKGSGQWDVQKTRDFLEKHHFLPSEMVVSSTMLICDGESVSQMGYMSQFYTHLLTTRFARENLVDWKALYNVFFP